MPDCVNAKVERWVGVSDDVSSDIGVGGGTAGGWSIRIADINNRGMLVTVLLGFFVLDL